MYAEDLARNNSRDGQGVEAVDEGLPNLDVASTLAFIVESVDTCDVGAFVVAAKEEEVLWELEFVAEQQQDGLERLLPAIDVVSEEEKVGARGETTHLEHADQIRILTVHIADDLYGGVKLQQGGLGEEALAGALADGHDFGILETDTLGHLAGVARIQEALDVIVEVDILQLTHGWRGCGLLLERPGRRGDGVNGVLPLDKDGLARLLGRQVGVGTARGRLIGHMIDFAGSLGSRYVMAAGHERRRLYGRGRGLGFADGRGGASGIHRRGRIWRS